MLPARDLSDQHPPLQTERHTDDHANSPPAYRPSSPPPPSPSPPAPPRSRRRARTSSAWAPASPISTRPQHIKDAAIEAINAGFTKYTAVDGTPSLKAAIIAKFKRDNGLDYTPEADPGLLRRQAELLQPGAGGASTPATRSSSRRPTGCPIPDIVHAGRRQAGDRRRPASSRASRSPRRSWKRRSRRRPGWSSSTARPTPPARSTAATNWRRWARCCASIPQVLIATDDMYEHIRWTTRPSSTSSTSARTCYDRTLVLNGVSKAYSMTGWRIGYAAGPEAIMAMKNVQSQSTSNPTSISQVAAEAALNGDQDCITPMVKAFKERHGYRGRRAERHPRHQMPGQRRRLLRLPRRAPGDHEPAGARHHRGSHRHRLLRIPAGVGRRRRRPRLGLRRRRLYPPVVRHLAGQSGKGAQAHRRRRWPERWPPLRRG